MKNTLIPILFLLSFSAIGQSDTLSREELINLFREINRSDVSYLNEPGKRKEAFVKNFDTLVSVTRQQGFPRLPDTQLNKNILENGVRGTFLHILQTNPDRMLNREIIFLFKKEILQGRLDKNALKFALRAFQQDQEHQRGIPWTNEVKRNFKLALKKWDIKLD